MANSDPSKTEQATPKRIEKTRNEGRVAKSQELTKAVTLAAGVLVLVIYIGNMQSYLGGVFSFYLGKSHTIDIDSQTIQAILINVFQDIAIVSMPIILAIGVVAFITLKMQVGALWTMKVFELKFERFNPINGLRQMFASLQTFIRLGKTLLQSAVIGYVPYLVLVAEIDNFLPLFNESPEGIAKYMLDISLLMVLYSLVPMFIIGIADYIYTRYEYFESIKMSKQEVKDEHRQSEGDPLIKQKQKQKMMEMMSKRMLKNVPKADVIITNPTHIAVALAYDTNEAPAPLVIAMGVDHMAERIKEIARENNIPIRENVPLARALYNSVEVGDMIPEELYKAVAAILANIWKMKGKIPGR